MATRVATPDRKRNVLYPIRRGEKGWITGELIERYRSAIRRGLTIPLGTYPWAPEFGHVFNRLRNRAVTQEDVGLALVSMRTMYTIFVPDIFVVDLRIDNDPSSTFLPVELVWGLPGGGHSLSQADSGFIFGPETEKVTV